jgi:hypothetical protein
MQKMGAWSQFRLLSFTKLWEKDIPYDIWCQSRLRLVNQYIQSHVALMPLENAVGSRWSKTRMVMPGVWNIFSLPFYKELFKSQAYIGRHRSKIASLQTG